MSAVWILLTIKLCGHYLQATCVGTTNQLNCMNTTVNCVDTVKQASRYLTLSCGVKAYNPLS